MSAAYLERESRALDIGRDVVQRLRRIAEAPRLTETDRIELLSHAATIETTVQRAEDGDASLGDVLYAVDDAIAGLPAIE